MLVATAPTKGPALPPLLGLCPPGQSGLTLPRQRVTGPMRGSPWKAAPAVPRPADGARSQAPAHAVRTKVQGASRGAACLTAVSSRGLFQGQGPGRNPWELGSELCQLSPGPAWGAQGSPCASGASQETAAPGLGSSSSEPWTPSTQVSKRTSKWGLSWETWTGLEGLDPAHPPTGL